jgi:hypothetical protein
MKKYISAIFLMFIILLQVALAIVPSVSVASAAGNVTINDFTSNVTKGQFPLHQAVSKLNSILQL